MPSGQVCRLIEPVSSHTGAIPGLALLGVDGWGPGRFGLARIASRRWASIGMPSENRTWVSRRCQASRVLAPALSLRTRTGWSRVGRWKLGEGEALD